MFARKEPDGVDLLMLVLHKMTEGIRACRTEEELKQYLRREIARPQAEHDSEMRELVRQVRREMRG